MFSVLVAGTKKHRTVVFFFSGAVHLQWVLDLQRPDMLGRGFCRFWPLEKLNNRTWNLLDVSGSWKPDLCFWLFVGFGGGVFVQISREISALVTLLQKLRPLDGKSAILLVFVFMPTLKFSKTVRYRKIGKGFVKPVCWEVTYCCWLEEIRRHYIDLIGKDVVQDFYQQYAAFKRSLGRCLSLYFPDKSWCSAI